MEKIKSIFRLLDKLLTISGHIAVFALWLLLGYLMIYSIVNEATDRDILQLIWIAAVLILFKACQIYDYLEKLKGEEG